jgi:uncharacterized membrane protein YhaH (DUF805 family)
VSNNTVLRKRCGTKGEEVRSDFWAVQMIIFILGEGSLYIMERLQFLLLVETLTDCLILF